MKRRTPHNTGFASGGVTCKEGALCIYSSVVQIDSLVLPYLPAGRETRPIEKPENVGGHPKKRQQH